MLQNEKMSGLRFRLTAKEKALIKAGLVNKDDNKCSKPPSTIRENFYCHIP